MLESEKNIELPMKRFISFDKLLRQYDEMANSKDPFLAKKAKYILDAQKPYPELREGFRDLKLLKKHERVIEIILQDSFSSILSKNEIKAASLPYADVTFNRSERFEKILKNAGSDFKLEIRDMEDKTNYIMASTVILNYYYGFHLDFSRPLFYDIPDAQGIMHHYRIMYNADFMDIVPNGKIRDITQEDVDLLLENFDDIDLWKKMIPPNSFLVKGFVISNLFDVTSEFSISEIKSALIASDKRGSDFFMEDFQNTFKSLFRLPNLKVGFSTFNEKEKTFEKVYGVGIDSFLLYDEVSSDCETALCPGSFPKIFNDRDYFAVADVNNYYKRSKGAKLYKNLKDQGIKSAILAPIADGKKILGILELASTKTNNLNNVNAQKLEDVMPYIVSAVLRSKDEEENLIEAIIQKECTRVHSSVAWKFNDEAKRFLKADLEGLEPSFKEIVFKDVFPLYGQIDIKDSSKFRNDSIQKDLLIQLSKINKILTEAWELEKLPIYEELIYRVNIYSEEIKDTLKTSSEQSIFDFVQEDINPIFKHLQKNNASLSKVLDNYNETIDQNTGTYYHHRRNYDESVMKINEKLASVLDKKQQAAQDMFPHYFERYKTDGIEHNMYIGASISEDKKYNSFYLSNIRLWQLQVMCAMENEYYHLKQSLSVPLDVASLLLVYSASLSIRFRMDEKRFDVDGTYNARYEVIKKRIDKSYIKGTNERLTQKGKLAIVYSQKKEELEYLRYIKFLRAKGYFTKNVEILELEGLQGVAGLKAIRVEILYKKEKESKQTYTYNDLMEALKN